MVLIVAIVLASWVLLSVFALALCVAAGGADRALDHMMRVAPPQEIEVDFVAGFAEPQPETAAPRTPARSRSTVN